MIERDGNRLRVSGALTIANAATLCASGKQYFGNGDIDIDLSAVTDVDSSALSLLFEWRREAQRRGHGITFRNLPASLQSLAALYGVADLVAGKA